MGQNNQHLKKLNFPSCVPLC